MPLIALTDILHTSLLAALPPEGGYFSVAKVALMLVCFLLWAQNAAWVPKDARKVRIRSGPWTYSIFFVGLASLVLFLLVPVFWISLGVFVVAYLSLVITYCVIRNKRVSPAETVLTPAHIQRLMAGKPKGDTDAASQARDRVRIKDHDGKAVKWPTNPEQHAGYQALQDLLFDAIWRRASQVRIDIVPQRPVKIVYTIDGVDRAREPIEPDQLMIIAHHLKKIGGMNPEEQRKPQTGRFRSAVGPSGSSERAVDIEVKTSGSTAGQRILLQLFSEESKFRLVDIGFTKKQLVDFEKLVRESKGVIIVSGPRGGGLSSTQYAILRAHDAFMQNIHTLEITKMLDLENVTQHVFDGQDGTVSFGKRFRSVIRTEPDVAMASDTPDAETAAMAAAAGRQGKKVYLGLTASDSFSALRKYLTAVGDNGLAASSLLAITNQRLVRVLCTTCRRAYKPDPALLKKANLPTGENRPLFRPPNPKEVEVDKQGNPILCPVCQGTGYVGRHGVFEILFLDDELRAHIAKGASLQAIKTEARKKGMPYLQEVALEKVFEGITSINEVVRVTREAAPPQAPPPMAAVK